MQPVKIILLAIVAACLYGVVQDQVTARVCVEYFTIGHPPVFKTESPTLLAFGWGVIATWWVGAILGIALALAARTGRRPKLPARDLVKPVAILLACIAAFALVAGVAGYIAARSGAVWLMQPLASRIPADRHAAFIADLWAHLAAYGGGFIGGVVLCVLTGRRRGRIPQEGQR